MMFLQRERRQNYLTIDWKGSWRGPECFWDGALQRRWLVACMQNSPVPFRPLDVAQWNMAAEGTADGRWYVRPKLELGLDPVSDAVIVAA